MRRLTFLLPLLALAACQADDQPQPSQKEVQARQAANAAQSVTFSTGNAEIENIKRRLELTSKPGAIGFILLLNEAGQPILYTSVKGKITSSTKRLTTPDAHERADLGERYGDHVVTAPNDEGTYGQSDPYIYFWTVGGQYMQWSGRYLYSDQPIRTRIEPLVVTDK